MELGIYGTFHTQRFVQCWLRGLRRHSGDSPGSSQKSFCQRKAIESSSKRLLLVVRRLMLAELLSTRNAPLMHNTTTRAISGDSRGTAEAPK